MLVAREVHEEGSIRNPASEEGGCGGKKAYREALVQVHRDRPSTGGRDEARTEVAGEVLSRRGVPGWRSGDPTQKGEMTES
jgi:hypothetical protein